MKTKIPLETAERIAQKYIERLSPLCERIEVAGSIRRRKAEVGDIEIVAIPKPFVDMFGNQNGYHDLVLPVWIHKNGRRYKQFGLPEGINLDLFIVLPPAQWGVIFALRTGGAEFSHKLVSHPPFGYLPEGYVVRDGAVHRADTGEVISTPEEADFLGLCGAADKQPWERRNVRNPTDRQSGQRPGSTLHQRRRAGCQLPGGGFDP